MDPSDMKDLFEEGLQAMRMNYHRPCPQSELVMGLNSHSDASGLIIHLQINEMDGLQIKKDGKWVHVKPLLNAFIINIGDALEIVTNGTYPNIEHRATINSGKEKLSIVTFYGPNLDKELGPALSLITPDTPTLFKRVAYAKYLKGFLSRELQGKSYIDLLRIQNDDGKSY